MGPPGAASAMPGPPAESAAPLSLTLTGRVKSAEPLVVTTADGSDVAVQLPEAAQVLRRADGDISAVQIGDSMVATGQVDADGYLAADRIYLGETVSMGRSGGRSGRGGGFPGFGMPPMMGPAGGQ